jgi:hypothetical protein
MEELDNSTIDASSHGIISAGELIQIPDQSPPSIPTSSPKQEPISTPSSTLDHTAKETFIYDSETVTHVVSDIVEQTLVDLVKKSLENEEMKKQNSITLTHETERIINNIISLSPNTLIDIEKAAIEIINDGKIDSKDIPNLVIIIQSIYKFIYSLKSVKLDNKKRADVTASIFKYILHLLVLERKIKIEEDKQAEFFKQTDLVIDSCISLLSYSKVLKNKGCFKKLFFDNTLKINSKDIKDKV